MNVAAISVLVPRLRRPRRGALVGSGSFGNHRGERVSRLAALSAPGKLGGSGLGIGLWAAGWVAARLVPPGFSRRSILSAAMALLLVSGPAMAYGAKKLPILRGETG